MLSSEGKFAYRIEHLSQIMGILFPLFCTNLLTLCVRDSRITFLTAFVLIYIFWQATT